MPKKQFSVFQSTNQTVSSLQPLLKLYQFSW